MVELQNSQFFDFAWERFSSDEVQCASALCELLCLREGYSIFTSTDSNFFSRSQIQLLIDYFAQN